MSDEWSMPGSDVPIRQGDLVISRDPQSGNVLEMCLIITADCDISQNKFGTHLACLRVISYRDYLRRYWAGKKLRSSQEKESKTLSDQLNKWNSRRLGITSAISPVSALDWIRRADPADICHALQVPEDDAKKVIAAITRFRDAMIASHPDKQPDDLARLVAFRSALSGKKREEVLDEMLKQAHSEEHGDDMFLLSYLPQMNLGPVVVLLRELVPVRFGTIVMRTIDAPTADFFLRTGRLEPTFKYAISQAFGVLYSRIGLPKAYEERCKAAREQMNSANWDNL